jgi:glycosyltransferase involved in cell wall biosynthesis
VTRRRVLWFVNKMPLSVARARGLPSVRGGWLDSYVEIVGAERGIDLTVAFPDGSGPCDGAMIDGVTFVGLPTADQGSRIGRVIERWRHRPASPRALAAAARLIRESHPDLIHLHGAEGSYGLATRGCGVPTVLSIQGSPTVIRGLYLRGVDRFYLRSVSLGDFLKGRGPVHYHATLKARSANEAAIMAEVGHVAGRTEWDRRLAAVMAPQAVYHLCDEPLRDAFDRALWRAGDAQPACVFSTTGHYTLKGVGTLLRAIDIVRRSAPGVTLVLAGVLPYDEHLRAVIRHVRVLGLEDCVTLLGEVDAETLARQLTQASIFVNPSHIENSSNSLAEAQLVGVPCVASSAGGMVTTADNGSAALLFQDGDARALAGAVLSLLNDPVEAAQLGRRGRELAVKRHDRENIRAQILSIYDEMLGRVDSGADPRAVPRSTGS